MKNLKLFIVSILAIVNCSIALFDCQSSPDASATKTDFRLPPEYAPAAAVWLLWPNVEHKRGYVNHAVTLDLLKNLLPELRVHLVFANDSTRTAAATFLGEAFLKDPNLMLHTIPFQEFWARDIGPIFLKNERGDRAIADFNFNTWDYGDSTMAAVRLDEKLDENIAAQLGLPLISSSLTHESGDHEINSQGVLLCVQSVERQRNPGWPLEKMEAELKRTLGAKKIIWFLDGLMDDESTFDGPLQGKNGEKIYTLLTTNGHVDEFARFVNDSTILLASVDSADLEDPIARQNDFRLSISLKLLENARNLDGKPFRIVRLPLPKAIIEDFLPGDPVYDILADLKYTDGSVFPKGKPIKGIAATSYCNFLIAGGVVIAPKYARAGSPPDIFARDEQARKILASVFPDRKIVMIDALAVNFCGGGIHCITMQMPE